MLKAQLDTKARDADIEADAETEQSDWSQSGESQRGKERPREPRCRKQWKPAGCHRKEKVHGAKRDKGRDAFADGPLTLHRARRTTATLWKLFLPALCLFLSTPTANFRQTD